MIGRFKKVLLLLIIPLFLLLTTFNVKADEIEIKDFKIVDKTDTTYIDTLLFKDDEVKNNITFNELDDYINFEFKLSNTSKNIYTIEEIKDNNDNKFLNIDYSYDNKEITSGKSSIINIKISYKNLLKNVEEKKINNLVVTILLTKENGEEEEIVVPITGDKIKLSAVALLIAAIILIIILAKANIDKKLRFLILLILLASPLVIFAAEQVEVDIIFNSLTVKGDFDKFNVIVDKDNGDVEEIIERQYGSTVGEIAEPLKRGYKFIKWVDENNEEVDKNTVVTSDINIKAIYEMVEYNITYVLNDGILTIANPDKYNVESNITLNNPTKEGYTFIGWTRNSDETKEMEAKIVPGTINDITFTAHFEANNQDYDVIHYIETMADGIYVEKETEHLVAKTDQTVEGGVKTYSGFTYNPSQILTVKSGTIPATGKLILRLYYSRNRYNVSYRYTNSPVPTDATVLPATQEYKYEQEVTVAPKATATGYTFGEWSRTGTFNMPASDVEITGTFTANNYQIIFDKNDNLATGSMPNQDMTYDVEDTLDKNTYEKVGYHFTKWTTNANGTGTEYVDETSVKNLVTTGTITLYANYEPNTDTPYKVEHYFETLTDDEYAINNDLTDSLTGTTDTISPVATSKTVTGFTYDDNNSNNVKSGNINGDESLVLKLYYRRNKYAVSYRYTDTTVPNGATALPTTQNYKYEQVVTVAPNATAPGYNFAGWSRTGTFNMPAEAVEITGHFNVGTSSYKIEHYGEDLNGNYVLLTTETEIKTGTTNSHVVGTNKDVENHTYTELNHAIYSYNPLHPSQVSEGTIKPDGSLTLKFYYYRNKYELHIINETNVSGATSGSYYYGTQLTLVANERDQDDEAFTKWSDGVTDTLTRTITITQDTTIGPYYHIYTVTLVSKDPRTTVATTTEIRKVDPGQSVVLPELSKDECVYPKDATHQTPQERECSFLAEFLGWYLDEHYTQKVESSYTPSDDTTLYAKWNGVYYHYRISGVREYSGTTGDYDDSGIVLYNKDNIDRDFEINFDLVEYGKSSFEQPTVMNGKYEKKSLNYPGFVVRFNPGNSEGWKKMQITSRWGTSSTERYIDHSDLWLDPAEADKPLHVKITRIDGVVKATYSTEYEGTSIPAQGTTITLFDQNASNAPDLPDNVPTTVTFGATVNEQGIPMRFFKGKLANIEVIMTSDMY